MNFFIIISIAIFAFGCGNSGAAVQNANTSSQPQRAEKLQSTTVHTTEGATPPVVNETAAAAVDSAKGGKFSAGGNPIDVSEFNKAIVDAEKALKSKPKDAGAKEAAADAYFNRGFALTEARQYAASLGDYRRALKLVPNHEESIKWQKQIIGIYEMMKKEYPKPGEEPSPLAFKNGN